MSRTRSDGQKRRPMQRALFRHATLAPCSSSAASGCQLSAATAASRSASLASSHESSAAHSLTKASVSDTLTRPPFRPRFPGKAARPCCLADSQ